MASTPQPRRGAAGRSGLTLFEMVIGLAILGTLAAIAIPAYNNALDKARNIRAISDIYTIQNEIYLYEIFNGKLPNTLAELDMRAPLDPWNNAYQYLNLITTKAAGTMRGDRFLAPLNSTFDLYSMGKDGKTLPQLAATESRDDIIRANDGAFIGLAAEY